MPTRIAATACILLVLCVGVASAQQLVEAERMGASFGVPEDWETLLAGWDHPKAVVYTFTSPEGNLYFEIDANQFNGSEELDKWVQGREIDPVSTYEEIRQVDHELLDQIGERGTTFRVRTDSWTGYFRFFGHQRLRMLIKIGWDSEMPGLERTELKQILKSVQLTEPSW